MSDRKKKKRALESQGFCHASGWIVETDMHLFDELVKKASEGVADVLERLGNG
jgi:hypothetical protein